MTHQMVHISLRISKLTDKVNKSLDVKKRVYIEDVLKLQVGAHDTHGLEFFFYFFYP